MLAALRAGTAIEQVLIQFGCRGPQIDAIIKAAKERQIKFQLVPSETFRRQVLGHAQGVAAKAGAFAYADFDGLLARAKEAPKAILVALSGVEDPRNLGAVVRTAEVAGALGVVIPLHRAAGMTEWAIRTSQGAALHLPVARVKNLGDALEQLKGLGFQIVGLDEEGEERYDRPRYSDRLVIVSGGEDAGLGERVAGVCDLRVNLPMLGKTPSLNVSVSTAVVLYEALRQQGFAGKKS